MEPGEELLLEDPQAVVGRIGRRAGVAAGERPLARPAAASASSTSTRASAPSRSDAAERAVSEVDGVLAERLLETRQRDAQELACRRRYLIRRPEDLVQLLPRHTAVAVQDEVGEQRPALAADELLGDVTAGDLREELPRTSRPASLPRPRTSRSRSPSGHQGFSSIRPPCRCLPSPHREARSSETEHSGA